MNVYHVKQNTENSTELSSNNHFSTVHRQQLATRYYIILPLLASIIVLLFNSLRMQIRSVTISSPTESIFDHSQTEHSSTFLSVRSPVYHQVCSSYLISSNFTRLLWREEIPEDYFGHLDSKILSTQFRFLSALCSLARTIFDEKIENFISRELITLEPLSRNSCQSISEHILYQLEYNTIISE